MKGHSESAYFAKIGLTDWVAYLVDWQWKRSRTQSIGPNDSNERCAISRVLFRINIAAITENTWPWPFTSDLDLFPWPLTLIFDLETDILLPWCFEENITKMYCFDVTWRQNGTSYVRTETNLPISILSVNILQPTRSLYDFPVPKLWIKRWFSWYLMCLTLTLTFQGHLIFVNSPFVPLHDWCTFWSDIFINSGDIAHWNMEKLPILYNGIFVAMETYVTFFRSIHFFGKLYRIGPSNMCVNFEKNRLNIDDFRRFHKSTISPSITYKIVKISKWPWPLTFIWPWPWVWPLTFDDLEK